MASDAATRSYIFKRMDGTAWAQITFAYPGGVPIPAWDGSYTRTWVEAKRMAEEMRNDFCKFERKRVARLKVLEDFEENYRDAA